MTYRPGDYLVICDRCGFKRLRSQCKKEWNGRLVCADTCWEPRHPQELVPPYRKDSLFVEDARVRPTDTFSVTATRTLQDFVEDYEMMESVGGTLAVSANSVTAHLDSDRNSKLVRDLGVNLFTGDFEVRFSLSAAAPSGSYSVLLPLLIADSDEYPGYFWGLGDYFGKALCVVSTALAGELRVYLSEVDASGNEYDTTYWSLSLDTTYYFEVTRVGEKAYLKRYTDGTYATVAQTAYLNLQSVVDYRYVITGGSIDYGSGSGFSGVQTVSNMYVKENIPRQLTGDDIE